MKKNIVLGLLVVVSVSLFIPFSSCSKKAEDVKGCMDSTSVNYNPVATVDDGSCIIPYQGPQNPSFEEVGSSTYGFSAANWTSSYIGINCYGTKRLGGTGFLPSKGSWYMKIGACPVISGSGSYSQETSQDFVSFDHSTTIIFDYSVVGSNIGSGGSGKVEILFTSNGTITLWSKTYAASSTPSTQQLNETVTLPSLPDKGKLIIRITYTLGTTPASNMIFDIDNIRVQ